MKVIARLFTACGAVREKECDALGIAVVIPYVVIDGDERKIVNREFLLERAYDYEQGILAEYRENVGQTPKFTRKAIIDG